MKRAATGVVELHAALHQSDVGPAYNDDSPDSWHSTDRGEADEKTARAKRRADEAARLAGEEEDEHEDSTARQLVGKAKTAEEKALRWIPSQSAATVRPV